MPAQLRAVAANSVRRVRTGSPDPIPMKHRIGLAMVPYYNTATIPIQRTPRRCDGIMTSRPVSLNYRRRATVPIPAAAIFEQGRIRPPLSRRLPSPSRSRQISDPTTPMTNTAPDTTTLVNLTADVSNDAALKALAKSPAGKRLRASPEHVSISRLNPRRPQPTLTRRVHTESYSQARMRSLKGGNLATTLRRRLRRATPPRTHTPVRSEGEFRPSAAGGRCCGCCRCRGTT